MIEKKNTGKSFRVGLKGGMKTKEREEGYPFFGFSVQLHSLKNGFVVVDEELYGIVLRVHVCHLPFVAGEA